MKNVSAGIRAAIVAGVSAGLAFAVVVTGSGGDSVRFEATGSEGTTTTTLATTTTSEAPTTTTTVALEDRVTDVEKRVTVIEEIVTTTTAPTSETSPPTGPHPTTTTTTTPPTTTTTVPNGRVTAIEVTWNKAQEGCPPCSVDSLVAHIKVDAPIHDQLLIRFTVVQAAAEGPEPRHLVETYLYGVSGDSADSYPGRVTLTDDSVGEIERIEDIEWAIRPDSTSDTVQEPVWHRL